MLKTYQTKSDTSIVARVKKSALDILERSLEGTKLDRQPAPLLETEHKAQIPQKEHNNSAA